MTIWRVVCWNFILAIVERCVSKRFMVLAVYISLIDIFMLDNFHKSKILYLLLCFVIDYLLFIYDA